MSCQNAMLSKRADESRLYPVQFLSDYGTYTIDGITVTAVDSEGYNVTSILIDETYNSYSGNTAQFMAQNGDVGAQYEIEVAAHMTDGEELIWKGTLTVTD